MMTTIHTREQLKIALSSSEKHARAWPIKGYNFGSLLAEQVRPGFFAISVSEKMVKKAVQILSVFLERMLQAGLSLTLDGYHCYHGPASAIVLDDDHFPFRIREKLEFTTTRGSLGISRISKPSGILVLELHCGSEHKPSRTITITDDKALLAWADDLVPYMKKVAQENNEWRIANEPIERQKEEEERLRQEKIRLCQERAQRAKSILEDIRLFERAEMMRKYCDIAEQRTNSEDYKQTLDIARRVADWIDPTTDYVDDILAERYDATDFV